jgi:hypothetical protein
MIIQKGLESDQVLAISQTAHAWVSRQLARQWGNECFPDFAPVEPLCYAAEQHDPSRRGLVYRESTGRAWASDQDRTESHASTN